LYSQSEVTIHIKNQGEEAFKPDIYGDRIIITRRFTKEGSSSYKIKSADGKLVSTKRDELSGICDHMNIQVDNPMNILTQGYSILLFIVYSIDLLCRLCQTVPERFSSNRQIRGANHTFEAFPPLLMRYSSFSKGHSSRNSARNTRLVLRTLEKRRGLFS
jgi:hypothetical protein